jgi:hypothetical protein
MRNKEIKEFMKELTDFWLEIPEQRFGQLLFNFTRFGTRAGFGLIQDIFHYQDKDILEDIKLNKEEVKQRGS